MAENELDAALPPPQNTPSPDDVGESVSAQVVADRQAAFNEQVRSALDFADPGDLEATTESKPETTPAPKLIPGAAVEKPDGFSDYVLERALSLGIAAEEARSYGSQALLEKTLSHLERQNQAWQRWAQTPKQEQKPAAETEPPPLPDLDPETFDPALIAAWKAQQAHFKGLVSKQQQQMEAMHQEHQATLRAREGQEYVAQADNFFSKCDPAIVGTGAADAISANSSEMAARQAICVKQSILEAGYRATGRKVPSRAALFEEAYQSLHGGKIAEKKIADKVRDGQGRFIAKPTSRETVEGAKAGFDYAVKEASRFMQEHGMRE